MFTTPVSLGKLGGIEASHLYEYLTRGPSLVRGDSLYVNAGVFCKDTKSLEEWCERYISAVQDLDYVLHWCPEQGDEFVINKVGSGKALTDFNQLEPFTHGESGWHYDLSDKKVLCVSPLADTIEAQVPRYGDIWPGASIGDVVTVRSTYSEALTGFQPVDWRLKMSLLKDEIGEADFDFAVVGCGGYSLEICQFIKAMGKSIVHLGGATQILFGIRGKRWDGCFISMPWYGTQAWVRPMPHEVPVKCELVENGCYW